MTGFGRGQVSIGGFTASVEIRSVNHRFADLRLKLPGSVAGIERMIHRRIRDSVHRGHVEVSLKVSHNGKSAPVEINRAVIDSYLKAARLLRREYRFEGDVTLETLFSLPDVVRVRSEPEVGKREEGAVLKAIDRAIAAHDAMRIKEGRMLARDISHRLTEIDRARSRIAARAPQMIPLYANRLRKRVQEINGGQEGGSSIDESRLAQEVALIAERSDVTEELVRLGGYIDQVKDLLAAGEGPIGKKLDFIMQELNREANTINSKAIDLSMCQDALDVKAEIEKIREQVQNVE